MNYKKIYDQLVEKCRVRGLDKSALEGYYEKHHIIPRCMGGSDEVENFVLFTPREHVVAHKLLWKAFPDNYSLMWAYTRTVDAHKGKGVLSSREVEKAKIAKAHYMSNREVSPETREKIRNTLLGRKVPRDVVEKTRAKNIGKKRTKETSEKLSKRRKEIIAEGWTMPEEARKKIGDAFRGKNISEEHKRKISEFNKGKVMPAHVLAATSAYQKSLRPWQKSAAIARPERAKVWYEAGDSYIVWLENGKPNSWAFSTIISKIHGTVYSNYHFEKLIEMFKDGWIPTEDQQWLEYKEKSRYE